MVFPNADSWWEETNYKETSIILVIELLHVDKGAIQKAHNVESQSLDIFFHEKNVGPVRQIWKGLKVCVSIW